MEKKTKTKKLMSRVHTPIDSDFITKVSFKEVSPLPLYECKDGGKTTDLEKAKLDNYGRPVCLGFSDEVVPVIPKTPICFDPKDDVGRLRAFQARASLEQALPPTIYDDKFTAIKKAQNSANAFVDKVNELNNSNSNT